MTQTASNPKVAVKQALAAKYRNLSAVAKSDEKKRFFANKAKKYQTQADHMS
jgi:hypothetical protein